MDLFNLQRLLKVFTLYRLIFSHAYGENLIPIFKINPPFPYSNPYQTSLKELHFNTILLPSLPALELISSFLNDVSPFTSSIEYSERNNLII